ncbi:MAG: signal recognition particle-docking protein FtsY [Varibaculum sp.]|nr:signal recognition particle-docking protein FtsY [Varibaculum sp.]
MDQFAHFFSDPIGISSLTAVVAAAAVVIGGVIRRRNNSDRNQPTDEFTELVKEALGEQIEEPEPEIGEQPETQSQTGAKLDVPESMTGRMSRLKARLAGSGSFGAALVNLFGKTNISETDFEQIEDRLLMADLGLEATDELMKRLREHAKVLSASEPAQIRAALRADLLELLDPHMDRSVHYSPDGPTMILVVGVNGTGKTTFIGRFARLLVAEGRHPLLVAADTFRAAAAEQLATWAQRVGAAVHKADHEGADPASVAFDGVKLGIDSGADVVVVDTAGRVQNKTTLMDELGKVKKVMEKQLPVSEVLLVLDATTGQNGLQQARVFAEAVQVTGIVLTKLDGSAKGGIVISVQRELGVPVKFVGLGEGPDDLAPFSPEDFADALLAQE